jgi:uncharacterized protein
VWPEVSYMQYCIYKCEGEDRWQTIGMVNGVLPILVAYPVVDEEEEVLRVISARRVTRQERIDYEEASQG